MKASVFVGTSLDGFIARPDGAFDFLSAGGADAEPHGFEEFLAGIDVILMGRNTYEVVLPMASWPYGTKPVFVLSNRPLPAAPAGALVERIAGTPAEVLEQLASRGFQHVYVDGGLTIQAFLRAGLVQRLVVSRVPVLIGSGISLFGPVDADIPLRHVATRQFAGGLVQSEYEVLHPRSAASPDQASRSIVSRRLLGAPRDLVFQAFADPGRLARWWGPAGFTNTFHEFDFRPGGDWRFDMHGPNGVDYPNRSVFVEVSRPERLVIRHVSGPQFELTITLAARGDRTEISWHMLFPTAADCERIRKVAVGANEQNFDRLEAELATMP